jgi:long-chain acyl-CoA synthetase
VTGRITDMVISGGVNIYPAECERILSDHPDVADVALFGVPDEEMGERLVGMVSRRGGTETGDLIAYCRERIAHYKVPTELLLVTEIPRTAMGKHDKAALRSTYNRSAGRGAGRSKPCEQIPS